MEKTLINLNQYRAFLIPIYDDPTNQHRPMGFEVDFNTHTQMSMMGYTCGYITQYPIDDKIDKF